MGDLTRAVLVGVDIGATQGFDASLDELALLASSAGDIAVARVIARRKAPDPALFVGSGKADEIKLLVQETDAAGVIFDQSLSPVQQRNLEKAWGAKVIDRTGLILEIFGARAQTKEGRIQVELAALHAHAGGFTRGICRVVQAELHGFRMPRMHHKARRAFQQRDAGTQRLV